ncbi:MAG TPA: hypothetical protein VMF06_20715 [Candidatus Limnocylindria bacterium]|jgi:YbbR domain-containing protein|nr:hypothetical protein [Candidatus Limnocylindria bacterium]
MRDFFRHNFWQKFFSLFLAVLIWFTVKAELSLGRGLGFDDVRQTFERVPVAVLRPLGSGDRFTIDPPQVMVTISGDAAIVKTVTRDILEVYVNMVESEAVAGMPRRVRVRAPSSVQVSVYPEEVRVRRLPESGRP